MQTRCQKSVTEVEVGAREESSLGGATVDPAINHHVYVDLDDIVVGPTGGGEMGMFVATPPTHV